MQEISKRNDNSLPDSTVIKPKAEIAPTKTVSRGCLIAIMAAMKNVLSPNSDTIITENDATNAWKKPKLATGSELMLVGS